VLVLRGISYERSGAYDRAIDDYGQAIKLAPHYGRALNARCWARALANKDLDAALDDCNAALALRPQEAEFLDSRAFLWLRMQRFEESIRDADAVLATDPKKWTSLYVRGVANNRRVAHAGDADLAAARALHPEADQTFSGYGVKP
jgi:tetratricopeptide (TPR) repeat protein